jgi:hypothetical protein
MLEMNARNPFEAGFGLKLDRESDGEIEGAFEKPRDFGEPMSKLLSPSPYRLSGSGGYKVPFSVARVFAVALDFKDIGDNGRSSSRPLLFVLVVDLGD